MKMDAKIEIKIKIIKYDNDSQFGFWLHAVFKEMYECSEK